MFKDSVRVVRCDEIVEEEKIEKRVRQGCVPTIACNIQCIHTEGIR